MEGSTGNNHTLPLRTALVEAEGGAQYVQQRIRHGAEYDDREDQVAGVKDPVSAGRTQGAGHGLAHHRLVEETRRATWFTEISRKKLMMALNRPTAAPNE